MSNPGVSGAYDVFLSYHWRDRAQVEDLARALEARDLRVFFDRWYLTPGLPWPQELEARLGECRAVVVCIGAGELGPWQQREAYVALARQVREKGFPVIPVLLSGAEPPLGFLGQITWVDWHAAPSETAPVEILAAAIRREPPGPGAGDRVARTRATVCPYRGLLHFREEDAPFFFGREAAVAGLVEAVRRGSLVAVVGASGCGKSSVVRAGLVPALRRDEAPVWDVVTIVPGARPIHSLAAALLPLLEPDMSEVSRLREVNELAGDLETGAIHLPEVVARVLQRQPGTDRLLLVADQWEELYTLTTDEGTRRRFVDELLDATVTARLTVVLTLRGDFVGHALAYRRLSDSLQGAQVNLGPMRREELRQAIEQPAAKIGLRFEAGLVDRILDDAGDEPGHLPLLEFVLRQLWERRQHGELRHDAYEALGRLPGAIATRADEVFARLSSLERQAVQRVFLALATPTREGDWARRRAARSELGAGVLDVVKKLADERLLVTAQGGASAEETVEVAHEELLRRWDQLRAWLDGHREFLLWRRRFAELVTTWRKGGQREDALAPGVFLAEAERWQHEQAEQLTPEEREYIAASAEHRRREAEAEKARVARELSQAQALAEAEAERAREAEVRQGLEAERAAEAERRRAAEAERAREAEERALAQRRATRWALAGVVLLIGLAVVLGTLAIGPIKRELTRRTLARDLDPAPIPAPRDGTFLMGCVGPKDRECHDDERPRRPVQLSRSFELMKLPVSVAQFRRFSEAHGLRPPRQPQGSRDDSPVVNVSWDESRAFCEFVGWRLPTEPEWEYAARGKDPDRIYPWGDERPTDEARVPREGGFDLRDMAGNVWQWTSTVYHQYPYDARYERDPSSNEARVVRGGSFVSNPGGLRVSLRIGFAPGSRVNVLGFRCARDGSP